MPFITVSSSTGNIHFWYTISTPSNSNAESLDPDLPVLLFFQAMAFHIIFHSQFNDPLLRKFNLVTFDYRWNGDTTSDRVPEKYGVIEATEDVLALMDALQLPPCHLIAMDMGSMVAMQIASANPKKALSLYIMSHLCLEELPDVRRARTELNKLWFSDLPDAYADVALGYTQYAFSSDMSNLAQALFAYCASIAFQVWGKGHETEYCFATYDFHLRKRYSDTELARIRCPVRLIHGGNNIVYPESYAKELVDLLEGAGVNVSWRTIPRAPHYLCVDHALEVNRDIHDFVVSCMMQDSSFAVPEKVVSPWDKILRTYGWNPEQKNDLDDEDLTVSFPPSLAETYPENLSAEDSVAATVWRGGL